jgi:hypothetical protein
MRKGFLIYMTVHRYRQNFLIYEENLVFFFVSLVLCTQAGGYPGRGREGVESGYSTQSREKGRGDKEALDSDSQVWHPQELTHTS